MKTMSSLKSGIAQKIRMVIGSIFLGSAFLATNCFAQAAPRTGVIVQRDNRQSGTVPLEKFSGYYQFPSKAGFIRVELKENTLFATQIWDNKVHQLIRINETNFESKEEGHKIEFLKDSTGRFAYAKLLGRIVTVKVGFNPQEIKELPAAQLKRLQGTYILEDDNSLKINIRSSANGLTIKQLWDNKEITFTPRSETFFLNEDGTFPLTFLLNDGEAVQVTCFKDDIWLKEK